MNLPTFQSSGHDRLGISLPRDLVQRVRADAEAAARPVSWQLALIIRDHYQRQEALAHGTNNA